MVNVKDQNQGNGFGLGIGLRLGLGRREKDTSTKEKKSRASHLLFFKLCVDDVINGSCLGLGFRVRVQG